MTYDELKEMTGAVYHPDPEIDAEVREQTIEAEKLDLAAGYPPRVWVCVCGASHGRGSYPVGVIGSHRCMACGYVGFDGVMVDERSILPSTGDWVHIAQMAGKHGIRYPTNEALEAFLASIGKATPHHG